MTYKVILQTFRIKGDFDVSKVNQTYFQNFLISLINVDVGINMEGVQKLQNQKMGRLEYCS